jgi:exodeoxyribonuclease-3
MPLRLATWNVNSVRTRLDGIRRWLEARTPDVLCLQETKVEDGLFPAGAFEGLGYTAAFSGQKAYNGVAILSRLPLEDVRIGFASLLPDDAEARAFASQKRVISALVDGLRVVNLYVPNGSGLRSEKYAYKLAWLGCLGRYLEAQRRRDEPLCLVGDFNIAPEDRDIHDPERLTGGIMASDRERQALQEALGADLSDAFRLFESAGGHWSWWDYRSGAWDRDRGWRIDHIYLDGEMAALASGCLIDRDERGRTQPSDHAPVVVTLAWPPDEDADGGEDGFWDDPS